MNRARALSIVITELAPSLQTFVTDAINCGMLTLNFDLQMWIWAISACEPHEQQSKVMAMIRHFATDSMPKITVIRRGQERNYHKDFSDSLENHCLHS
jgi:hypothetical protein